jgi:hypothetical protein
MNDIKRKPPDRWNNCIGELGEFRVWRNTLAGSICGAEKAEIS